MKHKRSSLLASAVSLAALVGASGAAYAQNQPQQTTQTPRGDRPVDAQRDATVGAGAPSQALPAPRSDNDARPPVASPALPAGGLVEQAGVGGTTAYARAGVLELGGNIGFNAASNLTTLSISPTIGWFFADNVEISGIIGYQYANVNSNDSHTLLLLAEPSVHIPFSRMVFGFAGVGLGLAYATGPGAGFAVAPRLGVNLMVGRSGVLTPSVQLSYATNETVQTQNGALLAVSTSFGLNVGYTVMW